MNTNKIKEATRKEVWEHLRKYARPDSRFHWDFNEFIPDFEGSEICNNKIRKMDIYQKSRCIFVTPDNCLEALRNYAINDRKHLVVSTYGIGRDFFYIAPDSVPKGDEKLAATLDGMEYFGKNVSLKELKSLMKIDLMFTVASIITPYGLRWGKGHGYFDLEWAMFWECNIVDEETTIFAVAHDCQMLDLDLEMTVYDTIVDIIITPKTYIEIEKKYPKPTKVYWDLLTEEQITSIPALSELRYEINTR